MFYILVIFVLFLYWWSRNKPCKYETRACFLICLFLVFLAAFRGDFYGDTAAYRRDYFDLPLYQGLNDLIDRYNITYIGYYGLSKLFSIVGMPVQVWFAFIEAFYLFAMMRLINKFSKDRVFSLIVFITSGLFMFSIAGLKQTLASSFLMLSFICYTDKKYKMAIPLFVAAYFTHQATMVFGAAFIVYALRSTKSLIPGIILVGVLIYFYSLLFLQNATQLLGNEHFEDYLYEDSTYSNVTFIYYVLITLLSIIFMVIGQTKPFSDENNRLFIGLSVLACFLQLLAGYSPSLFRLSLQFVPFMMVLLPNSLSTSTQNKNVLSKVLTLSIIIFYFFYTNRYTKYVFY